MTSMTSEAVWGRLSHLKQETKWILKKSDQWPQQTASEAKNDLQKTHRILGHRLLTLYFVFDILLHPKLLNESWMKKMEHLALKTLDGSNYQKSIMSMQLLAVA